ncbi:zf-HC2 domain-containing protein [Paraburkholderia phosphatilytica]|uniref:zf-HC2 domain-containing protein n=1 Tax=Paraburkholderia phosphatilytica TaxID=2282883 RepID=UPI000E4B84DD|nr:zf-HC2 domain-containing protein [Paraburkholderia phosphatilytica]
MNCDDVRPLLDASMDRELSAADDWRVRQHLSGCADCQRDGAVLRAVSGAMRSVAYQRAPESLRAAIVAGLPAVEVAVEAAGVADAGDEAAPVSAADDAGEARRGPSRAGHGKGRGWRGWLPNGLLFPGVASKDSRDGSANGGTAAGARAFSTRWLAAFGFALCAAVLAVTLLVRHAASGDDGGPFVDELVASHVRAELSGRDIDVVSTDRHTVKPWFNGRIDYAPPVFDMAPEGFALVGGRLDYVGHERVAVLVYRYKKHVIDVYVFPPGAPAADGPAPAAPRDGYAVARWQAAGMAWWAVSDAEPDALAALHKALDARLAGAQTEKDAAGS